MSYALSTRPVGGPANHAPAADRPRHSNLASEVALSPVPRRAHFGLGGHGQATIAAFAWLAALRGRSVPSCVIDNAAILSVELPLPGGGVVHSPGGRSLHLEDAVSRRTIVLRNPLLLRRYEAPLRSIPAGYEDACAGNGGSRIPLLSRIDLEIHIAAVRKVIRETLKDAANPGANAGDPFDRRLDAAPPSGPVDVVVSAGGTGSCGAGTSCAFGYLISDEARKLNLRVRTFLLLGGPHAFHGLTDLWDLSWGTTLDELRHRSMHGLPAGWEFIDGSSILPTSEAPYNRIVLLDEPDRREKPSESDLLAFAEQAAHAAELLLSPELRDAFFAHIANGAPRQQAWPGLTTCAVGRGGIDLAVLRAQLGPEFRLRRLEALERLLRPTA